MMTHLDRKDWLHFPSINISYAGEYIPVTNISYAENIILSSTCHIKILDSKYNFVINTSYAAESIL
jgi:hypothetical protein